MQFSREEEITAELNMSEYVTVESRSPDKAKQGSVTGRKLQNMID